LRRMRLKLVGHLASLCVLILGGQSCRGVVRVIACLHADTSVVRPSICMLCGLSADSVVSDCAFATDKRCVLGRQYVLGCVCVCVCMCVCVCVFVCVRARVF